VPQEGGGFKRDPSGEQVISRLDADLLRDVASRGSGAYVQSTAGPADVRGIFVDEIKGKLQSADTGVRREKVWDERFQWPLAVGLLCFLLAEFAERFVRERRRSSLAVAAASVLFFPASVRADLPPDVQALVAQQIEQPNDLDLAERVGEALYRAGEYDRARQVLEDVAARTKSTEQKTRAEYNAALSAYKNGHLTEAIDGWKSVLGTQKDHPSSTQNLAAAEKELQARIQKQDQQPQQQQQDQEEQRQQEQQQEQQQQDQSQQQQQQQQQSAELQEQSEQELQGTTGERGEIEPADGEPEMVEGAGSGSGQPMTEQELSEAEAKRFLDSLEEGTPRVPMPGRDNTGRDW
jgi:Ca-activated chloride channel family protein